jgi:multiple sugar transport system ATP-binding protein
VNNAQRDFTAEVQVLEPMGVDTMVFLDINGQEICARAAPHSVRPVGEPMEFTIDMSKMHLIDPRTDKVV